MPLDLGKLFNLVTSNTISPLYTVLKVLNVGILNVRKCQENYNKNFLFNDVKKYHLQILGITGTHIKGKEKVSDSNTNITNFKFSEEHIQGSNNFAGEGCITDFNFS